MTVTTTLRRSPLVALLALCASLPAAPAAHAQSPAVHAEVMAPIQRMFDGMRAGDSAMVRSAFHPHIRMVSAGTARDGKLRINVEPGPDAFLKAVGTPHPAVWDERIWNEKIHVDGPVASVWVDYNFYAGTKFSHCGIDHFLLVKDDAGAWKILQLADTRRTDGCDMSKD